MNDEDIKKKMYDKDITKALSCCVKGDCFRCPLYYVHNCRTALREEMNNILNKQQIELVLKRNTINDLNNKLTEKQSENEKLQSLCTSKDVIIKDQQAEIEQLLRNLKQCENGYSQQLHLARCKIEELKSLCTSEDKLIKELRTENERLQKKYDRAMDNLKAVLKEREDDQNV